MQKKIISQLPVSLLPPSPHSARPPQPRSAEAPPTSPAWLWCGSPGWGSLSSPCSASQKQGNVIISSVVPFVRLFEDPCEYKLYLYKEKFDKYKLHN